MSDAMRLMKKNCAKGSCSVTGHRSLVHACLMAAVMQGREQRSCAVAGFQSGIAAEHVVPLLASADVQPMKAQGRNLRNSGPQSPHQFPPL